MMLRNDRIKELSLVLSEYFKGEIFRRHGIGKKWYLDETDHELFSVS